MHTPGAAQLLVQLQLQARQGAAVEDDLDGGEMRIGKAATVENGGEGEYHAPMTVVCSVGRRV